MQSYGVALFVGLLSGAYSSIFIASPLLAWMKEREPRYKELAARSAKRAEHRTLTQAAAAMMSSDGTSPRAPRATASSLSGRPTTSAPIQARARKQKRR